MYVLGTSEKNHCPLALCHLYSDKAPLPVVRKAQIRNAGRCVVSTQNFKYFSLPIAPTVQFVRDTKQSESKAGVLCCPAMAPSLLTHTHTLCALHCGFKTACTAMPQYPVGFHQNHYHPLGYPKL